MTTKTRLSQSYSILASLLLTLLIHIIQTVIKSHRKALSTATTDLKELRNDLKAEPHPALPQLENHGANQSSIRSKVHQHCKATTKATPAQSNNATAALAKLSPTELTAGYDTKSAKAEDRNSATSHTSWPNNANTSTVAAVPSYCRRKHSAFSLRRLTSFCCRVPSKDKGKCVTQRTSYITLKPNSPSSSGKLQRLERGKTSLRSKRNVACKYAFAHHPRSHLSLRGVEPSISLNQLSDRVSLSETRTHRSIATRQPTHFSHHNAPIGAGINGSYLNRSSALSVIKFGLSIGMRFSLLTMVLVSILSSQLHTNLYHVKQRIRKDLESLFDGFEMYMIKGKDQSKQEIALATTSSALICKERLQYLKHSDHRILQHKDEITAGAKLNEDEFVSQGIERSSHWMGNCSDAESQADVEDGIGSCDMAIGVGRFDGKAARALGAIAITMMALSAHGVKADSALQSYLESGAQSGLTKEDLAVLNALYGQNGSKAAKAASRPIVNKMGEVKFIFGASQPTLVCSLLNVSDIALEPNENIVDLKVGDSARWIIERSVSGSMEGPIEHITVKPTDIGLKSNLKIYTDRRTYTIQLKSSANEYIPAMSFIYPEKSINEALSMSENAKRYLSENSLSTPYDIPYYDGAYGSDNAANNYDGGYSSNAYVRRSYETNRNVRSNELRRGGYNSAGGRESGLNSMLIDKLDFAYSFSGKSSLTPLRVYTDGHKTFIQMSEKALQGSLPGIVVVNEENVFSPDKIAVTNYRLINDIFVVDGVPKHLRVIKGEQGKAQCADITMLQENQYF